MIPRACLPLALALALGACGTGRSGTRPGESIVVGTIVDAATGEPLSGVRVEGPGGAHATSGRDGRFELRGLSPGDQGDVTARLPDGRSGRASLRPLEAGPLEVVLHLSRP